MDDAVYTFGSDPKPDPLTSKPAEKTVLDRLRSEISKKVTRPDIIINVPERPGVSIRVSPNISQGQMKAWRRNSGENSKAGFDAIRFACQVIAHTTVAILIDDEEAIGDHGYPLTFGSPEIMEWTETTRPWPDAVQAFFGLDPHVEAAALAIMDHAGYGEEVETADPTKTSSTT